MKIHKFSSLPIFIGCVVLAFLMSGCASMRPPVVNTYDDSVFNYKYFYIPPTEDYTSTSSSQFYANQYGAYGREGVTKITNPGSVISGILLKNGFIPVNEINPDDAKTTMIVNFGEAGRRNVNWGYSIEVTIQFISASTQQHICSCTAEGQGETEADDVREAIQRALEPLFK